MGLNLGKKIDIATGEVRRFAEKISNIMRKTAAEVAVTLGMIAGPAPVAVIAPAAVALAGCDGNVDATAPQTPDTPADTKAPTIKTLSAEGAVIDVNKDGSYSTSMMIGTPEEYTLSLSEKSTGSVEITPPVPGVTAVLTTDASGLGAILTVTADPEVVKFPEGATSVIAPVVLTLKDPAGNESTVTINITVNDYPLPVAPAESAFAKLTDMTITDDTILADENGVLVGYIIDVGGVVDSLGGELTYSVSGLPSGGVPFVWNGELTFNSITNKIQGYIDVIGANDNGSNGSFTFPITVTVTGSHGKTISKIFNLTVESRI